MSEITKYEAYKKKLEGLCDEHNMTFSIKHDTYPMTMTICPLTDMYSQIDMLASVEDKGYISQDAYIKFIMKDGEISIELGGTFPIGDTLFTKLRALFKNLNFYWTQFFFRDVIEKGALRPGNMPVIDEDEVDDFPEDDDELDDDDWDLDDTDIQMATSIVRAENEATAQLLQRRMKICAEKADRLIIELEDMGVIGPDNGCEPREVLASDEPDDE